jgi:hypothetical protein
LKSLTSLPPIFPASRFSAQFAIPKLDTDRLINNNIFSFLILANFTGLNFIRGYVFESTEETADSALPGAGRMGYKIFRGSPGGNTRFRQSAL